MPSELIQPKTRTIAQYSSVSLTASAQVQNTFYVPPVNNVTGLDINLSVTSVGTLVTPTPVINAISRLVVMDKSGQNIMDLSGSDLAKVALLLSPRGAYVTPAVNATTAVTWNCIIPITASLSEQPLSVQVTFAPFSALAASGATGGTITLTLNAWFGSALNTTRIYKKSVSVLSGDNSEGIALVNGKSTSILGFSIGTEANLTDVTFSATGAVDDYNKLLPQQIIDLENEVYQDNHQTGLFNLFVTPFNADITNTRLVFNCSSTDTINLYQIATN